MFWPVPRRNLCAKHKHVRDDSGWTPSPIWNQDNLFVNDRGEFVGSHAPTLWQLPVMDGAERQIEEGAKGLGVCEVK